MPKDLLIIGISGGSGSGKSTIAQWIMSRLRPFLVQIINEDDYNHDHGARTDFIAEEFNFDDIIRRDHELLAKHLHLLRSGVDISSPRYCLATHRRMPNQDKSIFSRGVIIIEGIHVLYHDNIVKLLDLGVYVDAPDDIRFARRVLRDISERGREPEQVVAQYLSTVRPMHYRYTYPGRARADFVILNESARIPSNTLSDEAIDDLVSPIVKRIRNLSGQET